MSEILTGQPDSPGPAADTGPARDPGRHEVLPPADWEPGWEPLQDTDPAEDFALAAAVADWDPGDSPAGPLPPGWTGAGEAFPAGFLHRVLYDDVPRGAGFASGGVLDEMEAGPVLALLTDSAAGPGAGGHAGLGESELIGVLCAWRRIASWAAAGQATAVLALSRRRHVQAREQQNRHLSEHVGDEIAAALTLTGRAAAGLHEEVLALARLPEVHQCLAAGRIDWPRAGVFARELRDLDPGAAAGIAARVLPAAPDLTTAQLRARLRRLILAHDPGADDKRKAEAAKDTGVWVWTEASGRAALAGRELPEAEVLAVDRRLTALARWLADRGAPGSIGQLRSAAFMTLLRGCAIQSLLPAGTPATRGPGDPAAGQPAVTGTINLTMPLWAWAGLSQAAGEIAGYGPAGASTCRDLAALLAADPAAGWQLTLTDPAGHAIATAAAAAGQRPPPGPAAIGWATGQAARMTFLQCQDCRHPRAEHHYQPSRHLRNLVRTRQRHCSFPGCRRPAARCDIDHTLPYDQGGLTCECNLAPLCRHHHRAKQAPGWHLTQTEPGVMTWTLPSGRSYSTTGEAYPV